MNNRLIVIVQPTAAIISESYAIHEEAMYESSFNAPSEDRLLEFMIESELWSPLEDERLRTLPAMLEALKLELWASFLKFQSKRIDRCKKQIKKLTLEHSALFNKRYSLNHFLAIGIANIARLEFLVSSLATENGKELCDESGRFYQQLTETYCGNQLDDMAIRRLAQSNIWHAIWSAGKSEGAIIGCPSSCFTDEQRSLFMWTKMYDNILESPDCPHKDVLADDVLLDGWLLTQAKARDKERQAKLGDEFASKSKKAGMGEVFIPAETKDDAKRIEDMNDFQAKFDKRQRAKVIERKGTVAEQNLPDAQIVMRQQALQQIRDRNKRK